MPRYRLLDRFVPGPPSRRRGGPIVTAPPTNPDYPQRLPGGGGNLPRTPEDLLGGLLERNPSLLASIFPGRAVPPPRTVNGGFGSIVPVPAQPFSETASFPTGTYSQEPILPGSRGEVRTVVSPISGLTSQVIRSPDPYGWNQAPSAPFGKFG